MFKKLLLATTWGGGLLASLAAIGSLPSSSATQPQNAPTAPAVTDVSTQQNDLQYCPQPNQLILKNMWWGAPDNWRSYNRSFVKEIVGFSGAQWVGVNVGTIICIYQGNHTSDFPVMIQRSVMVPMPTGGLWIHQSNKGYINCIAEQVTDCPFLVPKPAELTPQQIYQTLDSFKSQSQPTQEDQE